MSSFGKLVGWELRTCRREQSIYIYAYIYRYTMCQKKNRKEENSTAQHSTAQRKKERKKGMNGHCWLSNLIQDQTGNEWQRRPNEHDETSIAFVISSSALHFGVPCQTLEVNYEAFAVRWCWLLNVESSRLMFDNKTKDVFNLSWWLNQNLQIRLPSGKNTQTHTLVGLKQPRTVISRSALFPQESCNCHVRKLIVLVGLNCSCYA